MEQVLNRIRDVDANNSDAVKEAVNLFFQTLSKKTGSNTRRWLTETENVINRFPKFCMSHRNSIEGYLKEFLESDNYFNVIAAARCAHALQQVRPSQEKTATPKSSWRCLMLNLCASAHSLLDVIFKNAVDIHKNNNEEICDQTSETVLSKALTKLTVVPKQNKTEAWCTRLKNVFIFMQAMLVEAYPVAKPVRPQAVLDIIVRALTVSSGQNQGQDIVIIKTQALTTLDALIVCLGSNLIPYSPLVIRIVMQSLRWSSENPSEDSKKVRMAAYSTLSDWLYILHVYHPGQHNTTWQDELTTQIMQDITPPLHTVQLTMTPQSGKNLSKKAKRRLANTMLQESSISSNMPGIKNKAAEVDNFSEEVAMAALECAEAFLTVCGIYLKPATHKVFHERLVRECYTMQQYSDARALCSLRVIEASRKCTPATVAPPTQYCLHLYSNLINSGDKEISKFCSQALLDIRLHLHCSPPSLNFTVEKQAEQQKVVDEKQKVISERNRAALEALLGSEKIPPVTVTIEDDDQSVEESTTEEPHPKKPRIEDEDDKISLSSESAKSIEIDDNDLSEDDVQLVMDEDPTQDSELNENHIHEAQTQMPVNSNDVLDGAEEDLTSPKSLEVAYDYPSTQKDNVAVLDKIDDENLPSTNDTDDVQIACGQVVKYSQDMSSQKNKPEELVAINEVPIVNGSHESSEKIIQNGHVSDANSSVTVKLAVNNDVISVEDMMADFVDEVADNVAQA